VRRLTSLLVFLVLAPVAHAGTPEAGFTDSLVASGLSSPTAIAFLPNGKLLVTEKNGALRLVAGGTPTTITTLPVCTGGEMGLLGVAVDPGFSGNGFVYLYRTKPDGGGSCADAIGRFNQVVRVTMSGDTVVPGSLTELQPGVLQMRTDNGNHNGGGLRIGPDNKLYVSVGDSGVGDSGPPGSATNPYAQDLNALEGKVLRLELNGSPAAGNPYIGVPGRDEVWASGMRNPFRFGFDPVTGGLWLGDVGQDTLEEIDIVVAGGDYAWPHCEGTLPTGCHANVPGREPIVDPIFEYFHPGSGTPALGETVIGGAFPAGSFGPYTGNYFFADFISSKIYRGVPNAGRNDLNGAASEFVTSAGGPVDIIFGPDGNLYYAAYNVGQIRRVAPELASPVGASPTRISFTPAFQPCPAPGSNATHALPLSGGSCNPPTPRSSLVAVGSQSLGFTRMIVLGQGQCAPFDSTHCHPDLTVRANVTDVRTGSPTGGDYSTPSAQDLTLSATLPDAGASQGSALRLTDRYNKLNTGTTYDQPATAVPLAFPVPLSCAPTVDTTVGSTCSALTTANTLFPGAVVAGTRAVWEFGQLQVLDQGVNGTPGDSDDRVFEVQGVFSP
jgi:glucose/arabinose dehydrogenase